MTAICHLYDATTRARLCSCPCVSVSVAKMIATSSHNAGTINIVESDEVCACYINGETAFVCHSRAELVQWKAQHQLTDKPQTRKNHDHQIEQLQDIRRRYARHPRRSAATLVKAAA